MGQSYREAAEGGSFSVELTTDRQKDLTLLITYWGYESEGKAIDILLDDQLLTTDDVGGKWNQSKFFDQQYAIPNRLLDDAQNVKVHIKAKAGQKVPKIFKIRLIQNEGQKNKIVSRE